MAVGRCQSEEGEDEDKSSAACRGALRWIQQHNHPDKMATLQPFILVYEHVNYLETSPPCQFTKWFSQKHLNASL